MTSTLRLSLIIGLSVLAGALSAQTTETSTPGPVAWGGEVATQTIDDTITISAVTGTITSLRIGIRADHDYQVDADIYLVPPGVTWSAPYTTAPPAGVIELTSGNGNFSAGSYGTGTSPFVYTEFSSATDPLYPATEGSVTTGSSPFTSGVYEPEGTTAFNNLYGTSVNGDWKLVVDDNYPSLDDGVFYSWQITYEVGTNSSPVILAVRDAGTTPVTISNNDYFQVAQNSTVAALDMAFNVTDPDISDQVELNTTVSPSASINGFVQSEWNIVLASQPVAPATPSSGTFDTPGLIDVTLNAADDSTGTATLSFTIEVVGEVSSPYNIDFEAGDGSTDGWFASGPDAAVWEHGTPSNVGPAAANSGVNVWGTVLGGNHATNNAEAYLNTPVVDLTGSSQPVAAFYHHVDLEQGTADDWDGGTLQISVNGGAWVSLSDTDPGFLQNAPNSSFIDANGEPGWTGNPTGAGWSQVIIDLLSLTSATVTNTDTVRFRFWLATDGSVSNYPGWYIDDFFVDEGAEIDVQRPLGTSLGDASAGPVSDSLGSITAGVATTFTYTIENLGVAPLDLTAGPLVRAPAGQQVNCTVSVDTSGTTTPVAPGTTTSFDVDVTPSGAGGAFSFTLEIDSNDGDEPTYEIAADGTGVVNAPPAVTVPAGSNWVDAGGGLFTLTLDPGDAISDALEADDATPDDMTTTVTPPGTALTTLTAEPTDVTTPTAGPLTLQWTGTADAGNAPGDYDWLIDIDDGFSVTSITARITVNDLPPMHSIANADSGDGSTATPYATSFMEGDTGASSVDLASVTDPNTGQTVTIDASVSPNPNQTAGPSGGTGFQFNLSGGFLTVAPAGTLVTADAGTQVFDVTITDGANQVVITVSIDVVGDSGAITFDNTSPLPDGEVNQAYSVTLTVSGATAPVTYSIVNGTSLPQGLSLDANTGEISGTPTVGATTQFDVRVVDSALDSATQTFEITVRLAGSGNGSSSSSSGGCSTGETPFNWMIVLGLLSAVVLATRLRRSRS